MAIVTVPGEDITVTVRLVLLVHPEFKPPVVVSKAVTTKLVVDDGETVMLEPVPAPLLQVYLYPGFVLDTLSVVLLPLQRLVDPELVITGAVLTVAVTAVLSDSQMLPASAT